MEVEPWWLSGPFGVDADGLTFAGVPLWDFEPARSKPVYLYSETEIRSRLRELQRALAHSGCAYRIDYSVKANRYPPLLRSLSASGDVGVDAGSPGEIALARRHGFPPDRTTATVSMPSNADLDFYAAHGVHLTLDSPSALRRWASRAPAGTEIGIRLDPAAKVGYGRGRGWNYTDSKIGLPIEGLDGAVALAKTLGLRVTSLHMHLGWSFRQADYDSIQRALAELAALACRFPSVTSVNLGGGLGGPRVAGDAPLRLDTWADIVARVFRSTGLRLVCQPGTFLVDAAGVLVFEVNTLLEKQGVTWAGVNVGHPVYLNPALYGIQSTIIHLGGSSADTRVYSIAGHINESVDVFARGVLLPELAEGDLLGLYPAGAYGSSMASAHCLRGGFSEMLVPSGGHSPQSTDGESVT